MSSNRVEERVRPRPSSLSFQQATDLAAYLKNTYGLEASTGGALVVTITGNVAQAMRLPDASVVEQIARLTSHAETVAADGDLSLARSFQRTALTLASGDLDLDRPL